MLYFILLLYIIIIIIIGKKKINCRTIIIHVERTNRNVKISILLGVNRLIYFFCFQALCLSIIIIIFFSWYRVSFTFSGIGTDIFLVS